ncbi:MAG: aldo/keto reductase [Deltaproteobacteria bacterium]|nr:aldo/keto reductase [Deltaproteobacteria bacterium]
MKKLGFGFMRLPLKDANDQKSVNMDELEKMVDAFMAQGFSYFDTAWMYHDHCSENVLKSVLVERYPREAFTVATKMPVMYLKNEAEQESIFQEQQKKCGAGFFDYYLLHGLNAEHYETTKKFNSFAFIQKKKDEGTIGKIGFSYHDDAELLDIILREHPEVDFVQLQINYLDWENHAIQSRQCYDVASKHHKPVIVMEPVKGSTLAAVPVEAEKLFKACRPDLSVASWAIRFAASLEGVMMVLSGMSTLPQLVDNISYMKNFVPLDAGERGVLEKAREIINATIAVPCTACRYCVSGCPQNIPIPSYFALYNAHMIDTNKHWSVQKAYYGNYAQKYGKASDCIACGQCEAHCPQHIEIVKSLKLVSQAFDGQ